MHERQRRIQELQWQLEKIISEQSRQKEAIEILRKELSSLKFDEDHAVEEVVTPAEEIKKVVGHHEAFTAPVIPHHEEYQRPNERFEKRADNSNLERFIGENVLSKIGIAIIILGAAIGGKYAIDHGWLNPVVRIILGYILGAGLFFTARYLRTKYELFSSVLVGGSMAVFYLITFSAYSYYGFFPQWLAFVFMVMITAATVQQALSYDKQILAQFGLVGAYAVPFLLSDNSGRVVILFSYVAIINVGILIVAFRKNWKFLFYSAFVITWLLFGAWILSGKETEKWLVGLVFLTAYFFIFNFTFLADILVRQIKVERTNFLFLCLNALLSFAMGLIWVQRIQAGENGLAVFSICAALAHFAFYYSITYPKRTDEGASILVFSITTILILFSIGFFFEYPWIALLVGVLGLLYYLLGQKLQNPDLNKLAFPVLGFAFISWVSNSLEVFQLPSDARFAETMLPFVNPYSLVTFSLLAIFGWVLFTYFKWKEREDSTFFSLSFQDRRTIYTTVFLVFLFFAFRLEIEIHWKRMFSLISGMYYESGQSVVPYAHFFELKSVWALNFLLLFFTLLSYVNMRYFRDARLGKVALAGIGFGVLSLLTRGLFAFEYIKGDVYCLDSAPWNQSPTIRYITYGFSALAFVITWRHIRQDFFSKKLTILFDCIMHFALLSVLTYEILQLIAYMNEDRVYRRGLSILWASYALMLIVIGIWKQKKHLRIFAISIFGITLLKLFLFDLNKLSSLARSGLFILMGLFLLLISYLYLRYRHKIFGDKEGEGTA